MCACKYLQGHLRVISLWDRCCGLPCFRRDIALAFTLASPGERRWKGGVSSCCWLPRADLGSVPGVALGLTPVRWMSLQWAADPALLWPAGAQRWAGGWSSVPKWWRASLLVVREGVVRLCLPRFHTICQRRAEEEPGGEEQGGEEETRPVSCVHSPDTWTLCVPVQQVN